MKKIFGKILLLVAFVGSGLADDYEDGINAYDKKDYKTAFKLVSKSCSEGYPLGCRMLGAYYEDGIVIPYNSDEALNYYTKACDMQDQWSCKRYTLFRATLPVCSSNEISWTNDNRYFNAGFTADGTFPSILADAKTIQIDKKLKIINVWTIWLSSEAGRNSQALDHQNYENFGYMKVLLTINYGSMKNKLNINSDYNCNGSLLKTDNTAGQWTIIEPGSILEVIADNIKEKYKLK